MNSELSKQTDINKVVRQHAEMDNFFSGGFAVKGKLAIQQELDDKSKSENMKNELEKIAAQIANCTKCELAATRRNPVPGHGNPNAAIVFVGEAPGADEDAQGLPFVGRAGKLLDKIIESMGLKRTDVFICNILKCRPPGNRDPRPDEIASCLPYLQNQIERIKPEIIIALGAHAAKTLLKTNKPIGQLRGRFHDYYTAGDAEPIKLMPTYHPAYLLRNYSQENRRRVWEDMKKVMAELGI